MAAAFEWLQSRLRQGAERRRLKREIARERVAAQDEAAIARRGGVIGRVAGRQARYHWARVRELEARHRSLASQR